MIEFEALAMKTDINELHIIFLLKKNIRPPIAALETLKEWKIVITSVE